MTSESDVERLKRAGIAMAEALRPAMETMSGAIVRVGETIERLFERAYAEAGKPYGESREAMMRWVEEVGRIARLRAEADELEAWHRGLALTRAKIESRRAAD